ncbi:MAG: hypothetical protein JSS86_12940 [Cyanobacteria bacterium SZAS LIN-2]|nr:hypothetical protein [Cyanobacteria bacterium SZAS LIN-3]MBS1997216.1 hypothetical protein [Cyanobacteria bacterium SZAS LIN-2]
MDFMKVVVFFIFVVPTMMLVGALMALFGVVGSFSYELALHAGGSVAVASLVSGLTGLALVAALRYGVFRRLPFKRLELKDVYGWYIAFFVGFLVSPYLATVAMASFGHLVGEAWHSVLNYVLAGFVPVALAFGLDKLDICKLPSWDKDRKDPWNKK